MLQSRAVQVDGVFVGAAIFVPEGLRFHAVDLRVEELDASIWTGFEGLERAVTALFKTGRLGAARPPADTTPLVSRAA